MLLSISIPADTDVLIKEGDLVDFNTPLYKGKITKEVKVPLANILNINSKKIFTVLKKFVGEEVKKGDIIAFHAGVFTRKSYHSEHNGVIREVNHSEGYLVIESETDQSRDKTAWFRGEIAKITKNEKGEVTAIDLKVEDTKTIDAKSMTGSFGGKIIRADSSTLPSLTENDIEDSIVVTDSLQSFEISKIEALGGAGIITSKTLKEKPNIPYAILENKEDLKNFDPKQLPYCITDKNKGTIHLYR